MAHRFVGSQSGAFTAGPRRHNPEVRSSRAGFTLVELMITVAIVSILAAISLPQFSSYVGKSRTSEATGFLLEIKNRQESYRADFGAYCDVSGNQATLFPSTTPTANPQVWTTGSALANSWTILGASPPGRSSLFVYSTVAGTPGAANGPPSRGFDSNRGYDGLDFWFISTAVGDLDGDGSFMRYENYSHSKGLWSNVVNGYE